MLYGDYLPLEYIFNLVTAVQAHIYSARKAKNFIVICSLTKLPSIISLCAPIIIYLI
jgi:hypothetical protein